MHRLGCLLAAALCAAALQAQNTRVESGRRYQRIAIRGATVIEGNGTPAAGPKDILIENGVIARVVPVDAVAGGRGRSQLTADVEIDATGKFVMPGLVNLHAHIQDERGGIAMPLDYCLKLWLASGVTTIRDVGSKFEQTLELRRKSGEGQIAAPRIFVYPMFGRAANADEARAKVRDFKKAGADGIKTLGIYRDIMEAMEDEAHKLDLPIAHHTGVEETNTWDDIKFGTRSIEHWYGIPDAALSDGVQKFPAEYNYNNETDRFRYAGRLWREADHDRLMKVFDAMIQAKVAWDPTLSIYEASRDLSRAQNQPWFREYLHPTLAKFFEPNPANHGSYFMGWSSTDEAFWKENYRIWMAALREFERRGGLIGTGEDAGYIYSIYGFGLVRELELQQEAGFHPLKVLQHATSNGARILGQENRLGRVRAGWAADLLVIDGNPLEDLKVLYATGSEASRNGRAVRTGVEWTIKGGIPYHVPTLAAEIREMVRKAKQ
jgi:cytosine/adenosine deaminase-related metal-dependent hydrolase